MLITKGVCHLNCFSEIKWQVKSCFTDFLKVLSIRIYKTPDVFDNQINERGVSFKLLPETK